MNNKSTSLYNSKTINFTKEPMFLGTGKNTQRFDVLKYKFFDERNAKAQGFDWTFDEVKLKDDYIDFNTKMKPHEKFMYTKVLQKLIFLDSLQGRGILLTLGQICTLPELENVMTTWQYFEACKHSKTYTENLKGVYNNPSEVFDESFEIPELMNLADKISGPYDEAYELIIELQYKTIKNQMIQPEFIKKLKKAVLKLIMVINLLEGVRFYSGFATIWALNKSQGYVEGTSKNLKLICRDENVHLQLTQMMLKLMKKEKDEGFTEVYEEMADEIDQLFMDCYTEECAWIDYKFSQGSILGLNAEISKHYIEYIINKRRKSIGLPIMFQNRSTNPIPWVENYINFSDNEVLPQESEIVNYISGGVNNDETTDYDKMSY